MVCYGSETSASHSQSIEKLLILNPSDITDSGVLFALRFLALVKQVESGGNDDGFSEASRVPDRTKLN